MGFFPVDAETLRYLRAHRPRRGRDRSWSSAIARSRGSSAPTRRPSRSSPTLDLDLSTVVPSARRAAAAAGPGAARDAQAQLHRQPAGPDERERAGRAKELAQAPTPAGWTKAAPTSPSAKAAPTTTRRQPIPTRRPSSPARSARTTSPARRRRRHRRHHQLHQHLQPVGDDRRRPAGQEGRRARPHAPSRGSRPASRPARGWSPTISKARACCRISSSSGSTRWATAAPPASATAAAARAGGAAHRRALPGDGGGAERQPELRGAGPSAGAGELPRVPAAGGGVRAGRPGGHRPDTRAARATDKDGKPVYLKDIWPTPAEVRDTMAASLKPALFERAVRDRCSRVTRCGRRCRCPRAAGTPGTRTSTYVAEPPFFQNLGAEPGPLEDIAGARVLAVLGDSVTTDHISPAGSIPKNGPAARYLLEHGVAQHDWNTFGARRGHHEVMMRGTFGNVRIKNALTPDKEGNWTRSPADRRGDVDLRCVGALPRSGHAADRAGRQGVWHRLEPRLGRQGPRAAGRQGGDRRELRANPPEQSGGDGRAATRLSFGGEPRDTRPHRQGDVHHHRASRADSRPEAR